MSEFQKYGGSFKLYNDDEIYNGELYIFKEKQLVILELIIQSSEGAFIPRIKYSGRIPYISGTLFNGAKILLYDCDVGNFHTKIFSYTQQPIYVKYAFWGLSIEKEEDLLFNKAKFVLTAPLSWYDLCNLKYSFVNAISEEAVIWKCKEPICIDYFDGLKVTFKPAMDISDHFTYSTNATISQKVNIILEYENLKQWEEILDDINSINNLLELGCCQNSQIKEAKFNHSSLTQETPNGTRYLDASVELGTGKQIKSTVDDDSYYFLFTLIDFLNSKDTLTKWRKYYYKLKPILDLYNTAFLNEGTPVMFFLNLMQALETFHARFVSNKYTKYKSLVDDLVKPYDRTDWKKYLIQYNQHKKNESKYDIYLKNRIAYLILANWVFPIGYPLNMNIFDFIDKLVDTRNYYTHYDESKIVKAFTIQELTYVNGYLKLLLEYHILNLIGLDTPQLQSKIRGRASTIYHKYNERRN